MNKLTFCGLCAALLMAGGCSVNPVTGENEISLVSPQQEVALGEQNYAPSRQSQGGDYYLDPNLQFYLRDVGARLAAVSHRPNLPYEFVVLNNPVPNAWALPGGKIAVNRGLLTHLDDEAQLAAVLGHEIVHAAARHGAAQMTRGTLLNIGVAAVAIGSQGSDAGQLYGMASQLGAAAWMARYGRDDELESDRYGMQYMAAAGYDPQAAVELQQTFVKLSQGRQSDFLSGLFASHPPSQMRVDKNREYAAQLPKGQRHRDRYQRAIARLKKDAPAYQAEAEAEKLLQQKNPQAALTALDKAIAVQPNEARFWELRGHAWKMLDNAENADKALSTAISKNPNHFRAHLVRGIGRQQQGQYAAAESDIKRSYQLLKTPVAAFYLGETALAQKETRQAAGYFEEAAQDRGEIGQKARARLAELQLQLQPERFIATQLGVDSKGYLIVAVKNQSGVSMSNIQLQVTEMLNVFAAGKSTAVRVPKALAGGAQVQVTTGIGPLSDASQLRNFQVSVTSALPQQ